VVTHPTFSDLCCSLVGGSTIADNRTSLLAYGGRKNMSHVQLCFFYGRYTLGRYGYQNIHRAEKSSPASIIHRVVSTAETHISKLLPETHSQATKSRGLKNIHLSPMLTVPFPRPLYRVLQFRIQPRRQHTRAHSRRDGVSLRRPRPRISTARTRAWRTSTIWRSV